jgi:predicted transcriptional regulator
MCSVPADVVRPNPALEERLAAVAAALDRPKSLVIARAVEAFVTHQSRQLSAIEARLPAAYPGRTVARDDVAAWVQSWDRPDKLPVPRCG